MGIMGWSVSVRSNAWPTLPLLLLLLLLLHSVGLLVFYPSFWPAISLPTLNYFTTQYRLNNTFSIHPPSKDATITHRPEMCAASSPTTLHLAFSTKKFLVWLRISLYASPLVHHICSFGVVLVRLPYFSTRLGKSSISLSSNNNAHIINASNPKLLRNTSLKLDAKLIVKKPEIYVSH